VSPIQEPIQLATAPPHSQLDAEVQGCHHSPDRCGRELVQVTALHARNGRLRNPGRRRKFVLLPASAPPDGSQRCAKPLVVHDAQDGDVGVIEPLREGYPNGRRRYHASAMTALAPSRPEAPGRGRLALALLLGALVAVALGVYGRFHDPTGRSLVTLFFTATINLKVWLAMAAVTLAVFQVLSAAKFYGKLGADHGPRWLGRAHRASGTIAFLLTIPVAYHCLWALGFQVQGDARVLLHGLLGCLFFGTLSAKVLLVRSSSLPGWALPFAGGTLFTALIGVWLTSAFWYFTNVKFPGF
jgi:hypothetical protein